MSGLLALDNGFLYCLDRTSGLLTGINSISGSLISGSLISGSLISGSLISGSLISGSLISGSLTRKNKMNFEGKSNKKMDNHDGRL
jgi:hypothetical protein